MYLGFLSVESQVVESVRPFYFYFFIPSLCLWKLIERFSVIHLSSRQIKHICSRPKIMQQWPNCVETWISLAACPSQTWARLEWGPVTRLYQGALGLQESKSYLLPVLLGSVVKRDRLKYQSKGNRSTGYRTRKQCGSKEGCRQNVQQHCKTGNCFLRTSDYSPRHDC